MIRFGFLCLLTGTTRVLAGGAFFHFLHVARLQVMLPLACFSKDAVSGNFPLETLKSFFNCFILADYCLGHFFVPPSALNFRTIIT